MPISYATLQIYDHYLTTYGSRRSSRYDTHDQKELQQLYSSIQRKNRFAPVYLNDPTTEEITYAIRLKEQAKSLHETIDVLSCDDESQLFSTKTAYCSHPELAQVSYDISDNDQVASYQKAPSKFTLCVDHCAMPQRNTSSYLRADQPVMMPAGSYSFDLITNKLHYELQFDLQPSDTHEILQQRLMRLINNSDLGVHAQVLHDEDRSALEITSDARGTPAKGSEHFRITDENTSHSSGIVHYLGLNKSIEPAQNASYSIDGVSFSSYNNNFRVYDAYEVTLDPDAISSGQEIEIGLYPDPQSLAYNIRSFVKSYNQFIENLRTSDQQPARLNEDIHKLLNMHKKEIGKYGIEISDDDTLSYPDTEPAATASPGFEELQDFGSHLLKKLNAISMDPMEYLNRRICAYSNPATSYVNPYVTSIYSGMLFNTYC